MFNDPNLIAFEQLSPRKHRITLLVLTRPNHPKDYLTFFRTLASDYAYVHKSKLISDVNVELNPFRESAIVIFDIKGYKHPEKHQPSFRRISRNFGMR